MESRAASTASDSALQERLEKRWDMMVERSTMSRATSWGQAQASERSRAGGESPLGHPPSLPGSYQARTMSRRSL